MSILINNKTAFALKVYRTNEKGVEQFCNQLDRHQKYVQEGKMGDRFSIRMLMDDTNEVMTIFVSDTHHDITIRHSDLRSKLRDAEPGSIGIPENILCDLYTVTEDAEWLLSDKAINPNEAPFVDTRPGQLLVGTVPGNKESVLFWAYVYDVGDPDGWADEISYNVHVIRNFLRGNVGSNGFHSFEDEQTTWDRLLPSGVPQLFEGEVLLYQSPKFNQVGSGTGNYFWIFNDDVADVSIYAPPVHNGQDWIPPSISAQSFIPGPGTAVTVCSEANFGGASDKNDKKVDDIQINSLKIEAVSTSEQVGIRILTDLGEDTDANGNDVTRVRTTLIFNKPRIVGGKLLWPRVRLQCEDHSSAFINREATARTLDPVQWTEWMMPNQHGRLQIGQPTTDKLHSPALFIQTEEMEEHHVVAFHPSMSIHQRLKDKLNSADGNIKDNRKALGIEQDTKKLPSSACDAVQQAALNLAKMAVPNVSQDSHAIHAKHRVDGSNMTHRHFIFSLDANGHPKYEPMSKKEHADRIYDIENRTKDGIQRLDQQIEAFGFSDLNPVHVFNKATHFVVHAAEDSAGWVKDRAEDVGNGIIHVAVSVVDEVKHEVEAVVHYVEEGIQKAVRFAIKTVEAVGAFIKKVFDAIKLVIEEIIKFIKFLIALIKDIIEVYGMIRDAMSDQIDSWKGYIEDELNEKAITDLIESVRNYALEPFPAEDRKQAHPSSSPLQSGLEKLEWLFHVISDALGELMPSNDSSNATGFLLEVEETIIHTVTQSIEDATDTFVEIVQHPQDAVKDIEKLGANLVNDVFDGVEKIAGNGVSFIKENVDALDDKDHWNIPLVSYLKDLIGLSPLNIVAAFFAIPVGIVFAVEDVDPKDVTLSMSSNVSKAQRIFAGIGDYAKMLTSPLKTFNLCQAQMGVPATSSSKIMRYAGYVDLGATVCSIGAGAFVDKWTKTLEVCVAAAAIYATGEKMEMKGRKAATGFPVILDAVTSFLAMKEVITDNSASDIERAAMGLESIAGFLELTGFLKNEEILEGAIPGEMLLFGVAGTLRFCS